MISWRILCVELGRECRGAHEVAEHDRELTISVLSYRGGTAGRGTAVKAPANGAQQLHTAPEQQANFL